jgi:oxygen-independent coproporphyrinogen-3 oxidase
MELYRDVHPHTVYIGGGTPSMLSPKQFLIMSRGLHRRFRIHDAYEFSIEANPDSVDSDRVEVWLDAGINRVSLGVQSFNDSVLAAVGRKATEADIMHAARLLREAGVDNLGIDLILGLQDSYSNMDPERTFRLFRHDIIKAVSLEPDHVSVYVLDVDESTPLVRSVSGSGASMLQDDDLERMYLYAVEYLSSRGYEQYELSNFAKPGKESRHNMHYWSGDDYLGIGLGAVSTIGFSRRRNYVELERYVRAVTAGRSPVQHEEILTEESIRIEKIMLSLRMSGGIDIDALARDLSENTSARLQSYAGSLLEHGLAVRRGTRLALTASGFFRSNAIITDIVRVTEGEENRHS